MRELKFNRNSFYNKNCSLSKRKQILRNQYLGELYTHIFFRQTDERGENENELLSTVLLS